MEYIKIKIFITKKIVVLRIFLEKELISKCIEKPGFSCISDILKTLKTLKILDTVFQVLLSTNYL